MTVSTVMQVLAYAVTIGIFVGVTKQQFANLQTQLNTQKEHLTLQISNLEKKVEKHNNVIERMYRCEESLKSAHHRIDDLKGAVK